MVTYRSLALRKALSQVGVKESPPGSNRGPQVDKYEEADSLMNPDHGYSWCASFVNWCFQEAGRPLKELDLSASVGNLLAAARKRGWAHIGTPRPGDLVCYDWNTLTGPGKGDWPDHIGIVKSVNRDGSFVAVEGNTSVGNDSNGGEVMVRSRSRSMVEGFIRVPGGYSIILRYRVYRSGKLVATVTLAGLTRHLKALLPGGGRQVRRVRIRVEHPDA